MMDSLQNAVRHGREREKDNCAAADLHHFGIQDSRIAEQHQKNRTTERHETEGARKCDDHIEFHGQRNLFMNAVFSALRDFGHERRNNRRSHGSGNGNRNIR